MAAQLQGGGFSGEELAEGVGSILLAGAPDEEAAAELMEWMGMEAFELISSILEHRALVTGALLAALGTVRSAVKKQSADGKTPSVMQQVSNRIEIALWLAPSLHHTPSPNRPLKRPVLSDVGDIE